MMTALRSFSDVSQLIRLRRREKGWTQAELASRSGVAEKHISRIVIGANEPKISTVLDLMAALRLTLHALDPQVARGTPASSSVEDMF